MVIINYKNIMKHIYMLFFVISAFVLQSCGDSEILKSVDFSVKTEKATYEKGESVVFIIENAPNWLTFYSGEENKQYPDSNGAGIKGVTDNMTQYQYTYDSDGTYDVVFVGGNTNYKGSKEQTVKLTVSVK